MFPPFKNRLSGGIAVFVEILQTLLLTPLQTLLTAALSLPDVKEKEQWKARRRRPFVPRVRPPLGPFDARKTRPLDSAPTCATRRRQPAAVRIVFGVRGGGKASSCTGMGPCHEIMSGWGVMRRIPPMLTVRKIPPIWCSVALAWKSPKQPLVLPVPRESPVVGTLHERGKSAAFRC